MKRSTDIRDAVQAALDDYHSGRMDEAEAACLELLEQWPDRADCLHLLGLIAYHRREYDPAIVYLNRAIRSDPERADAYFDLGNAFQGKGAYREAVEQYRMAVRLNPDNAEVYNNMGVAFTALGDIDEAVGCYQEAIRHDPANALSYNNLGNAFRAKGQYDGAVRCFRRAVGIDPASAELYKNLGNALRDNGRMDEALAGYREALRLSAGDPEIRYNLANLYKETGQPEAAVASYRAALELQPRFTEACYNLGNLLRDLGRYDEAIENYKRTLELVPDHLEAYNNMGVAFKEKGDTDRAIACYENALKINPGIAETQWNLSLVYLLAGEFGEGWKRYEWRWQKADYRSYVRDFPQPLWDGSAIPGKTILLHAEQGYGDAVQFVRYAPQVAERGAAVIVEAPRGLAVLFETVEGVRRIVQRGDPLPPFDCHCPLLTLPMVFRTLPSSIPGRVPYLAADPERTERWRARLAEDGGDFKVGLVWSGNPEHKNDRNRSLPVERLTPLLSLDRVLFYSLQKGGKDSGTGSPGQGPLGGKVIDYTGALEDFADTAALIMNLDLVVSVDTAVAHLAGALGRPVWTMLPFAPDWRWFLHRQDSPWYPTMRLFRQPAPGDWGKVVEEMKACLAERIGKRT